MISYKRLIFNPLQVNCWILHDSTGDCLIFDPSCADEEGEEILQAYIEDNSLRPLAVLATHGHFDHVPGVGFVKHKFGCPFLGHQSDAILIRHAADQAATFGFQFTREVPEFDRMLKGGEVLSFGEMRLDVYHVPGHSAGSLAFYSSEAGLVISGDVLFSGSIGRTDLPGGDYHTLITSIRTKLLTLPEETIVLPGHGTETTIAREKKSNPFLA